MKKIIFRKFLYDVLSFFLVVSLSLSLIVWIIQSVNLLDFISKDGHGFRVYFSYIALNFPKIYTKLITFTFFISLFYIIVKYQNNNEILIFWTNGISKIKLVNFIIKVSAVFAIVQISLTYFVVPKTQDYSRDFIRSSNIDLFSSLITEKKFIDTVKDFTIFVESIDGEGNMKNIFIKDSVNRFNTQIISAKSGNIIDQGKEKFIKLKFGQILDITNDEVSETKLIKFNSTLFNLSHFKTKSTTFPKVQELNSNILVSCVNNFLFGNKKEYSLPVFHCSQKSSLDSIKEIFDRSIKQIYIIILGAITAILIFINEKSTNNSKYQLLIFFTGILVIVLSEINSQFVNLSPIKNIFFSSIPVFIFIFSYLFILNLYKRNI